MTTDPVPEALQSQADDLAEEYGFRRAKLLKDNENRDESTLDSFFTSRGENLSVDALKSCGNRFIRELATKGIAKPRRIKTELIIYDRRIT